MFSFHKYFIKSLLFFCLSFFEKSFPRLVVFCVLFFFFALCFRVNVFRACFCNCGKLVRSNDVMDFSENNEGSISVELPISMVEMMCPGDYTFLFCVSFALSTFEIRINTDCTAFELLFLSCHIPLELINFDFLLWFTWACVI